MNIWSTNSQIISFLTIWLTKETFSLPNITLEYKRALRLVKINITKQQFNLPKTILEFNLGLSPNDTVWQTLLYYTMPHPVQYSNMASKTIWHGQYILSCPVQQPAIGSTTLCHVQCNFQLCPLLQSVTSSTILYHGQ